MRLAAQPRRRQPRQRRSDETGRATDSVSDRVIDQRELSEWDTRRDAGRLPPLHTLGTLLPVPRDLQPPTQDTT